MPTVTEKPVRAFAHCPDPRCPGNQQEEVEGVERETALSYQADLGGDIPGVERSMIETVFAHEDDQACQHCAAARAVEGLQPQLREITTQQRKQYANVSGFADDFLSNPGARAIDPSVKNTPADEEMAALKAEMAALKAEMARQSLLSARDSDAEAA